MLCLHVFIQCALPVLTIIRQVATVIQQRVQVMPQLRVEAQAPALDLASLRQ